MCAMQPVCCVAELCQSAAGLPEEQDQTENGPRFTLAFCYLPAHDDELTAIGDAV